MQAGFTFSTRSDRDKFEQDMYNLKMSFVDIIRSSSPVIESGGIHNGDTYSISLFWNEDDDVDLEELTHQLKGLLVGAGYHPKIVDECFSEDAWSWFPEEKHVELQDN